MKASKEYLELSSLQSEEVFDAKPNNGARLQFLEDMLDRAVQVSTAVNKRLKARYNSDKHSRAADEADKVLASYAPRRHYSLDQSKNEPYKNAIVRAQILSDF